MDLKHLSDEEALNLVLGQLRFVHDKGASLAVNMVKSENIIAKRVLEPLRSDLERILELIKELGLPDRGV